MADYLADSENYFIFATNNTSGGATLTNSEQRIADAMANVLDGYDWGVYTYENCSQCKSGIKESDCYCSYCGTQVPEERRFLTEATADMLVQAFNAALLAK